MKKIIVILLSVLAVTACKKNNNKPGKTTPVLSDRLLVSKSVATNSESDSATNHTIAFYTYDDSNRMVKQIENAIYGSTITIDTTTYTYDNQGNLTTSEYHEYQNGTKIYGLTINVFYTAGVPDSSKETDFYNGKTQGTNKITYKVVNGQITQQIEYGALQISYNNNNVSETTQQNIVGWEKFTYDDTKKGPFYISHFKWYILNPQITFNQNPELTESTTAQDNFSSTTTYKNTYNSQGYVTKASYTVATVGASSADIDDPDLVQTTVYTYINAK